MKKNLKNISSKPVFASPECLWSNLAFLPVDIICTTWSDLRSDILCSKASELCDLPIRVVLHNGCYEVIDGFKRLNRWKETGFKQVPVIIEQCSDDLRPKRLLLESNSPRRTLTAMDEARVIASLIKDDGMTVRSVANLLGRRREWVVGRKSLLSLTLQGQQYLASGRINLMTARLLLSVCAKDQQSILEAFDKHNLKNRELQLLIQTWRSSSDEEKPGLIADPLFKSEQRSSPSHSSRLRVLEAKLYEVQKALDEFSNLVIPDDLPDVEQRRLQAICAAIRHQINAMSNKFSVEAETVVTVSTSDKIKDGKMVRSVKTADYASFCSDYHKSLYTKQLDNIDVNDGFSRQLAPDIPNESMSCENLRALI